MEDFNRKVETIFLFQIFASDLSTLRPKSVDYQDYSDFDANLTSKGLKLKRNCFLLLKPFLLFNLI